MRAHWKSQQKRSEVRIAPLKDRGVEALFEELAVYIREGRDVVIDPRLPSLRTGVEDLEEVVELLAEVGAIGTGAVANERGEGFGPEDAVVFGEEAEEETDEKALEFVPGEAASFERVVQLAHAGIGFFVCFILRLIAHPRLPEHEGEMPDVFWEIGENEMMFLDLAAVEKRKVELVLRFEIVEDEVGEIGNEHIARDFLPTIFPGEVFDVGKGLGLREVEVFAVALVLNQQTTTPEEVDRAFVAFQVADILLKGGDGSATQTENVEEVVPESLFLGALGAITRVLARKADGAVADFVPGEMGHGGTYYLTMIAGERSVTFCRARALHLHRRRVVDMPRRRLPARAICSLGSARERKMRISECARGTRFCDGFRPLT